jgi:hypothetical protein
VTGKEFDITEIDLDGLTLGEMEIVEDMTGLGLDQIFESLGKQGPKSKILIALGLVTERRKNPDVTVEEIRDMKFVVAESDPKDSEGI